ncbi:putative ribonuclease H-like domain-containing protein [Tanacetum coccineum]
MESDEFIKSSVENLIQNPSESEDECECDVPDCDDSQTTNFSTFSSPLFDDSTSSDDESSHAQTSIPLRKMIVLNARLPILNLGDYDLWLTRIEQYFLMSDYSLWEVIKNGNKVLKRTVGETKQEYEPTTAEEKQDKRNEMKARGTLLMALPNKDQLKFHSYKDAKLLMQAIEKSTNSNSSTNEADNTAYGVSAAYTQSNPTSGDNFSDVVICAFLATRRFIKRIGRKLDVNGQRVGFDRTKVECYNCYKNGHFERECRAPRNQESRGREINKRTVTVETLTQNALVAQDGIGGLEINIYGTKVEFKRISLTGFRRCTSRYVTRRRLKADNTVGESDSIYLSDLRLERTATFSISTILGIGKA